MTAVQSETAFISAARLCPTFVCRVAGASMNAVEALIPGEVRTLATRLSRLEAVLGGREDLSSRLFTVIGSVSDKRLRNRLLELRRDLFNLRLPAPAALAAAAIFSPELLEAIQQTIAVLRERDATVSQLRDAHERELVTARERFRCALTDTDFEKGLALSSRTLFRNLDRYRLAPADAKGSRVEQIERGLLRYFTRMATKATPFGRFCAVIPGEFAHADGPVLAFKGDPGCKSSVARLNKRIYAQLWDHVKRRAAVRARLPVEVNPTLRREAGQFVFLTAIDGREVFQRVPVGEMLDVVLEHSARTPPPLMAELINRLLHDPRCDANEPDSRAVIHRLIEIGMLRSGAIVAEQEADWLEPMCAFLSPIEDEHAQRIVRYLESLRASGGRFVEASAVERSAILEQADRDFNACLLEIGERPWFPAGDVLYEDATADARICLGRRADVLAALERLGELVALTLPLAGPRFEMATMRHFFDSTYNAAEDGVGIPLLEFYEQFYRKYFKTHLENVDRANRGTPVPGYDRYNPYGLDAIERLRSARERLVMMGRDAWVANPTAPQLNLTRDMLEAALAPLATGPAVRGRSASVFVQVVPDAAGSGVQVVVQGPQYNVGYGKYFSRFLYLLPQRCREEVVADNESLSDDLLAEICGDAAFNANLHPPLLPWEISYPTGQHAGSAQQLLSADIVVRQDPENQHALLLVHAPTGRRVLPVDLGFMSVQLRPPLYQLLARFSPCGYFAFPLPQSLHVPIPGTPPQLKATNVLCRPRITYEGTVVLARRCWMVPPGFFPIQTRDESDADFFVRVLRWRNLHGVPERAYVRVLPLFDTPETKQPAAALAADTANLQATEPVVRAEESEQHDDVNHEEDEVGGQREVSENDAPNTGPNAVARHPSRDWRKPQFIDFANPLLVRLFARLTSGLKRFSVVLEECLPTAEQLPRSDGAAYAVELVLQFGFPDGIETSANGLA